MQERVSREEVIERESRPQNRETNRGNNTSTNRPSSSNRPMNNSNNAPFYQSVINWAFTISSIPFKVLGFVLEELLTPGSKINIAVASMIFTYLVFLSIDSYWQGIFKNAPLFPWFETTRTVNWFPRVDFFPFSINWGIFSNWEIYATIVLGSVVQLFQSACLRGEKFVLSKKTVGFVAMGLWGFDFVITFISRNPWQFQDPQQIMACFAFNIFTIFCAEAARWIQLVLSGGNK
jgi:hypothetical protein